MGVPHLHVYREGYGDKFAYEVPPGMLKNPDNPRQVLLDFLETYHIERNGIVALRQTDRYTEITTPFLDRHNDQIQIYAVPTVDGWSLTDAGETLSDLEMCGVRFESAKRQALLHEVLQGFGVTLRDGELTVSADTQSQPQQMNNLIQAVLAVNDLFCRAQPTVYPFFTECVSQWLDEKAIRFSPQVSFSGKSTFSHHYGFLIPKSKQSPERLLKVMNTPNRDYAKQVAFSWIDTRETRPAASECFVLLNDAEGIPAGVMTSLEQYDMVPVPWGEREQFAERQAA